MDLIQIKSNLDLFSQQTHSDDSIEHLRNTLKKLLLQEIVKSDHENKQFFQRCLDETIYHLSIGSLRKVGYPCTLVGCQFEGERYKSYLCHIRRDHPNIKNVKCNFKKTCTLTFANVESLLSHLKHTHSSQAKRPVPAIPATPLVEVACQCNMISCGGYRYRSTAELMRHYNSYHANEERMCLFSSCQTTFHAGCPKSAMNHFRVKHKQTGEMVLKKPFIEVQTSNTDEETSSTAPVPLPADVELEDAPIDLNEADFESFDLLATDENIDSDEAGEQYYLQY